MSKSHTSSAASCILAAAIVLATWLPTVSTPSVRLVTAQSVAPAHAVLA